MSSSLTPWCCAVQGIPNDVGVTSMLCRLGEDVYQRPAGRPAGARREPRAFGPGLVSVDRRELGDERFGPAGHVVVPAAQVGQGFTGQHLEPARQGSCLPTALVGSPRERDDRRAAARPPIDRRTPQMLTPVEPLAGRDVVYDALLVALVASRVRTAWHAGVMDADTAMRRLDVFFSEMCGSGS